MEHFGRSCVDYPMEVLPNTEQKRKEVRKNDAEAKTI